MPSRTVGNTNTVPRMANTPMTSQLHEKMSNNDRAQRRALMEPIPSPTKATARTP